MLEGELLGDRYQVEGELGKGGMGVVYRCLDTRTGKPCAVKTLQRVAEAAQARELLARFEREVKIAAALNLPNIVSVYDQGLLPNGAPFLVMELLQGQPLSAVLKGSGPLEPLRCVRLFEGCLYAIGELHQQTPPLLHRDLTPNNLFLERPGTPVERLRVIDFGMACFQEGGEGLTQRFHQQTTSGAGTPGYIAPEYHHNHKRATPAADVYQLGLVMIEALSASGCPVLSPFGRMVNPDLGDNLEVPEAVQQLPGLWPVLEKATAYRAQDRYPDAGQMLAALQRARPALEAWLRQPPASPAVVPSSPPQKESGVVQLVSERKIPRGWVWVPPGHFWMGSPEGEPGRHSDERLHEVELSRGFVVCVHPVTQEEWEAVMGSNPSRFKGARRPVERVSWYDAIAYCNARSAKEGLPAYYRVEGEAVSIVERYGVGYRLLTEAEWEYLCRAGTVTATYNGDLSHNEVGKLDSVLDKIAWYWSNAGGGTKEVCQKVPNAWGVYDTLGNVWEWCCDAYESDNTSQRIDPIYTSGAGRVIRGGSWVNVNPSDLRAAFRYHLSPSGAGDDLGFRCVRSV